MQDAFGVDRGQVSKAMKNAGLVLRRSMGMSQGGNPAKYAKESFQATRKRSVKAKGALNSRLGKPSNPFNEI